MHIYLISYILFNLKKLKIIFCYFKGRFDHKLIRENTEPSLLFENYKPTGEELYCVMNSGECDATVPLYKWFDIADIGK